MQHKHFEKTLVFLLTSSLLVACGGSSNPPGEDDVAPGSGGMTSTPGAGGNAGTPGAGGAGGGSTTPVGGATGGSGTPVNPAPPCAAGDTIPADGAVISDFEDATGSLAADKGLSGGWYTYNDMTAGGKIEPASGASPVAADEIKGGRCSGTGGSAFALHVVGDGFTVWGAGAGTDLAFQLPPANAPADAKGMKGPWDASAYSGIAFWVRVGDTAGAVKTVRMNIKDVQTDPAGGNCSEAMSTGPNACHDDFGKNIPLTSDWKKHVVSFTEMKQSAFGKQYPGGIKKEALYAIQFQFKQSTKFDLWLDDIHFVK